MPTLTDNGNGTSTVTAYLLEADCELAWTSDVLTQILDDPVSPTGTLNAALMDQLIGDANGMIDEALAYKYAVPLIVPTTDGTNVGNVLMRRAKAIFFWLAIKDKTHIQEAYKGSKGEYDDAVAFLEEVKKGTAYLGTSATLPGSPARIAGTETSGHKGTFTRKRMEGW
jgi:phage gp36-like protein